ncbi:MAG: polysulfide reductase NrfD [Anaerolineales bacterium]|nr:polysulfide reductase NrfD [Anaerolineales bacterium]
MIAPTLTQKLRATPYQLWLGILIVLMAAGATAGIMVFVQGLHLTNMSDLVPWGLWITVDLSAIALSAGAFLLSAAVYLLGLKRYQPLARTAVFIGLIGYSMAMLMLLMDIGRPDRFWHAMVYWNPHSPLWEVTMCVMLYFSVLIMEVLPIFGQAEWFQKRWPAWSQRFDKLHHLAPVFAVIGLCLSMLHQSSLGATYGIMKARPIWYRPDMAVLFIVSAMAAGPSMTLLATTLAGKFSKRAVVNEKLIDGIAYFVGWVLAAYFYLRFWDMLAMSYTIEPGRTEGLKVLTSGQLAFNFWIGEMLLGALIPMIILLSGRLRRYPLLRSLALFLVVGGLVAYRWDTNLVGLTVTMTSLPQQLAPMYVSYTPSFVEWATAIGVIAYGFLAFTLGVQYLNVVDHKEVDHVVETVVERPRLAVGHS